MAERKKLGFGFMYVIFWLGPKKECNDYERSKYTMQIADTDIPKTISECKPKLKIKAQ